MFYTIYQTINKVNGKKYIGKHKTEDLDDEYLGSGIVLARAIEKYGRDSFEKHILFVFDNEQDMNDKEADLITADVIMSEEYYNVALGGSGGAIVLKPDHPLYESTCRRISEAQQKRSSDMSRITKQNHESKRVGMYGKTQSEYQRSVVSAMQKGKSKSPDQIAKQKKTIKETMSNPSYIHPNKGKKKPTYVCNYCNKEVGGRSNYERYHGDNCKCAKRKAEDV